MSAILRTLRQQFGNNFSRSAFKTIDGEQRIVGKWGQISEIDEGRFDFWFVGQELNPLSARKLASIEKKLHVEGGFRKLTC